MGYKVLATTVLVLHFAYLAYVVFGGFIAWRWPRAIWPHFVAGAWGVAVVGVPLTCPLTYVEHWARRRAGERGVGQGFIDKYIEGVLYPERYALVLQALAAVVVLVSWLGAYRISRMRRISTTRGPRGQGMRRDTGTKSEDSSERAATV